MPQRGRRVGEAERGEPATGLVRGEPQPLGRHPGDRLEQRAIEQLLVQPARLARVQPPLRLEHRARIAAAVRPVAEGAGHPLQVLGVVRQHPLAAQPAQLQPVLDGPQEAVGVAEADGVVAADVAAVAQRFQRGQGRRDPKRLVAAAVHELEQLHRELHVAQPARAELDVALRDVDRDVLEHPAAHRAHVGDEAVAFGGRPDHRRDRVDVRLAQREITGDRTGLEQRLELPGARPPPVVRLVAGHGTHERAVLAFRPQVRVHFPRNTRQIRIVSPASLVAVASAVSTSPSSVVGSPTKMTSTSER